MTNLNEFQIYPALESNINPKDVSLNGLQLYVMARSNKQIPQTFKKPDNVELIGYEGIGWSLISTSHFSRMRQCPQNLFVYKDESLMMNAPTIQAAIRGAKQKGCERLIVDNMHNVEEVKHCISLGCDAVVLGATVMDDDKYYGYFTPLQFLFRIYGDPNLREKTIIHLPDSMSTFIKMVALGCRKFYIVDYGFIKATLEDRVQCWAEYQNELKQVMVGCNCKTIDRFTNYCI